MRRRGAYGVVGGEATVDEVEDPRLTFVVFRLEVARREERRRGGGADRNVRQERVLRRPVLQLIISTRFMHACTCMELIRNQLFFLHCVNYNTIFPRKNKLQHYSPL